MRNFFLIYQSKRKIRKTFLIDKRNYEIHEFDYTSQVLRFLRERNPDSSSSDRNLYLHITSRRDKINKTAYNFYVLSAINKDTIQRIKKINEVKNVNSGE